MTDFGDSRRNFLKTLSTSTILSTSAVPFLAQANEDQEVEKLVGKKNHGRIDGLSLADQKHHDGPRSPEFKSILISGNKELSGMNPSDVSERMAQATEFAPAGEVTAWGIPFNIPGRVIYLKETKVELEVAPFIAKWLIFLHTSDQIELKRNEDGLYQRPFKGTGFLQEHVANYVVLYSDGEEAIVPIKERFQIGMFQQQWGENCFESVAAHKPAPVRPHHQQKTAAWGWSQTQADPRDRARWINWLYAWENQRPGKSIVGFRFEPLNKASLVVSGLSAGNTKENPLRWRPRQKAVVTLSSDIEFDPELDKHGLLSQVQMDLGQIISATPRLVYPNQNWADTYNNQIPVETKGEIIVEYAAHPDARFHLPGGKQVPVSELENDVIKRPIRAVRSAERTIKVRVVEKGSNKLVPVKFHAHGESDEYLAPVNRHRKPNNAWFEDYSVDFVHQGTHNCTYIDGETSVKLPNGKVFLEVSKGFEIKPVRKVVNVTPATEEIVVEIEKALDWRQKGWITADTHVHFLSPDTARLEGSAEGVNIINLLASQWGELMTNVGDFDGRTTHGSKEVGGSGEYMVRVGTENRQHVMGHISLLGYNGSMITPMTTGGPSEAAIGDPIEMLLTEWAQQCKVQDGVVVLPHFPNPRAENAASIVSGNVDGVEMTSWGDFYSGIDPYSLTDWYRYLNCGYFVAAVGGTDKMSAGTAVGTIRTYAKLDEDQEFTYDNWKESIRRGNTFVTYGPLLDFRADGRLPGSQIEMSARGGTVDVSWEVNSITVPMSRVELIVNGEVREGVEVDKWKGTGNWKFKADKSSWLALLVRGHYEDKPEIIVAHTSPVMIKLEGSKVMAAADALTILEQIEGAMAYLDVIGTRAEDKAYKRMKMTLESAHRTLHNRMHEMDIYHSHTPTTDHQEHHKK